MSPLDAPLPVPPMAFSTAVVVAAGIVRGFAGFGFSAISVAGLALVASPAAIVPAIFVLKYSRACDCSAAAGAMSMCPGSAG